MRDRFQIIDWRFINLRLEVRVFLKIVQYAIFSILAISLGYFSKTHNLIDEKAQLVVLLLPFLYIFNFVYYIIARFIFKYLIGRISFITPENRYHIFNSHSILIHIFLVYIVFGEYLNYAQLINSSDIVLPIIIIYALFFSLHRSLKRIDQIDIANKSRHLISILKYKSFEHSHIFAGTCIGLPFYIGLLLKKNNHTIVSDCYDALFAYIVFLISWLILYQHKFKSSRFLYDYKFIFPCAVFPITPLLFFLFYNDSLIYFYAVTLVSLLLFLFPIINLHITNKIEYFFNE